VTLDIPPRVTAWRAAPHISARSVLVTILGDAVLPVTKNVWLSQLFQLAEPYGFDKRLVRVSMFRLAEEGWVTSERHGRRSLYLLTPLAEREFADAAERIYRDVRPPLDGEWTFVLLDGSQLSPAERNRLTRHLGWHGFVAFRSGVLASPICGADETRRILDESFPDILPAVARAEFGDIANLARNGFFSTTFAFDEGGKEYREFVEDYEAFDGKCDALSPVEAYCIRTMLIHDLRRITLRTPAVPRELLPTPWPGNDAYTLAADLYPALCANSAPHLGDALKLDYPEQIAGRFPI